MTELNKRPVREWLSKGTGISFIAVLIIAWVIYTYTSTKGGGESDVTTTAVQPQSCEAWERTYAVITPETFPGDTLRVGPEQTWVFRLVDEEEWIGWIIADVKSWSVPTDSNEVRFPNGLVIVETPQNTRQISYPSNTFNVRGEGCRLMTTKRILAASLGLL